jgi:hypothetical protein
VLLAGVLAVSGCATGPGDAGDIPVDRGPVPSHAVAVDGPAVTGRALDTAGRPAAGATVVVTIDLSGSERAARNMKSFASLGLACFDETGCTTPTSSGRVAGDGRFVIAAPHGDVDRRDGLVVTVVAARGADARVATTVRVDRRRDGSGDAGTVVVAAGRPLLRRTPGNSRLVMPPVGVAATTVVRMSRAEPVDGGSQFVERSPGTDVSGGFDPRMVEDGLVLLTGSQTGRVRGRAAGFSASLVTSGDTVPPSRGAGCYVLGSRGQQLRQQPCGLTDGILDDTWSPRDDPRCADGPCKGARDHRDSTVVLDRPMRVGMIVVRGCGFGCRVAVSTDGKRFGFWRAAPSGSTDDVFVDRIDVSGVVAVRVRTYTGGFFSSLREVSVFS